MVEDNISGVTKVLGGRDLESGHLTAASGLSVTLHSTYKCDSYLKNLRNVHLLLLKAENTSPQAKQTLIFNHLLDLFKR